MIKSFKHKGLQDFYEKGNSSGIQAQHRQKIKMQLVALDTANVIDDITWIPFTSSEGQYERVMVNRGQ